MQGNGKMRCIMGSFLAMVCPFAVWADYAALPLSEMVAQSTLVAKVGVETTESAQHRQFRSTADCRVVDPIVGCSKGDRIKLRYDNGFACPNVIFAEGEEIVLFAVLDVDGTYSTVNYGNGKCAIGAEKYKESRRRERDLPAVVLQKGERCRGCIDFERIPIFGRGRAKLRVWAVVGPRISSPVDLDVNLDEVDRGRAQPDQPWSLGLTKVQ